MKFENFDSVLFLKKNEERHLGVIIYMKIVHKCN